jgi:endonuclease III related protein
MQKYRMQRHYRDLLNRYGKQGWWPVRTEWGSHGYHPEEDSLPRTRLGRFEICIGAILTQNTAWTNVEKALDSLQRNSCTDPESILRAKTDTLQEWVRSAGYYKAKSAYLKHIASWFLATDEAMESQTMEKARQELLAVKGVGPETADSILLYAYGKLTFVIDAYTRRFLARHGLATGKESYGHLRSLMMDSLPKDLWLYQEFHALIVADAKNIRKNP